MNAEQNVLKSNPANAVQSSNAEKGFSFYEKMAFLYFLNLIDWLCTEALLLTGRFYEANPLMQNVITGFWQTLLIKGAIPLALVIACCVFYKLAGEGENRFADAIIYIGITLYALLNLWHIFNFVLLFFVF